MESNINNCNEESSSKFNIDKSFNSNDENILSGQSNVSLCTQQKLELSSWSLPDKVLEFYKSKGITHMFQWQLECLSLGRVLDAGNLVYSAPTSAGKTLVAEILIAKTVFELQKKVLVILPFVSVVREKMFYFQGMYSSSGINVEGYMGGHSPSICFKQVHVAVCTIEKANSIINKLLEEQNLESLGLVVVDELHLLGDPYRGYLLELLLTKLKYISTKSEFKIQIVGMSATLPNLKTLADWIEADLYYTDFRPVPLIEKLKCGTAIYDKKLNKLSDITVLSTEALDDSENVGQLCLETISNGHSVLIFCPTKVWCENLAEKIALFFRKNGCSKSAETEGTPGWILRNQLNLTKINEVIEHLKMSPVGLDKDLHKTVAYGVAFHHAGLTLDERDIIEGSFRKGSIRVLCATSTLSSGVNLPARRVIIRSPMSFGGLMDILTYRQMIGRAGRMGVDSEGESILICKPNEKKMCQTLMSSTLKPIESCLGHGRLSASLKRALLEIVASGIAASPEEVKKYANCTFLAFSSKHDIQDPIQSCIEFLEKNEFIRLQENGTIYVPTPLAKACLASSLPPDEGLSLFRELQRARRCFVLDTDLHIIYQVTPYSVSEQWNKVDWLNVLNMLEGLPASMKRVGEMVGVEEAFLVRIVKGVINSDAPENRNKLSIHRRFYTSLALQDLVNEVPLCEVAEKYECNKGMLQSLQQSAATYAGMVTEFTKRLGWGSVELIFSQFQERLQFGIQRELCDLMRLPLLNAMRARALFNAGFSSLSAIANAKVTDLENVFFAMAPFQSKKEIAGETSYDKEQRNKLETVWITGKADLTIQQAAELLITESQNILQLELGLEGVQWGKKEISMLDKTHNSSINYSVQNGSQTKLDNVQYKSNTSKNNFSSQKKIEIEIIEEPMAVKRAEKVDNKSICDINIEYKSANTNNLIICEKEVITQGTNFVSKQNLCNNEVELVKESEPEKSLDLNHCTSKEVENNELTNSEKQTKELVNINSFSEMSNEGRVQPNQQNEIDYFASSFNFDIIPDYGVAEKRNISKCHHKPLDDNKEVDFVLCESDSNSSLEILYDSTALNASKNLSFSRLSEDIFEIPKRGNDNMKKMSTPIINHGRRGVEANESCSKSPDLFSQSLTFDTQLGKILDFEECVHDDAPQIVNPSSSFNSDDLGFVSDLSPAKPNQQVRSERKNNDPDVKESDKNLEKGNIPGSASAKAFKTPLSNGDESGAAKRKVRTTDSPDIIVDSDESMLEDQHVSKRIKYNFADNNGMTSSPLPLKCSESDDEIMPTPKLDKIHLSNISKISRIRNGSTGNINENAIDKGKSQGSIFQHHNSRLAGTNSIDGKKSQNNSYKDQIEKVKPSYNNLKSVEQNWDKISIIDVCRTDKEFKFFREQLKEQNIVGLALGCRRKTEEKKSKIGMKIAKKKKSENVEENLSKCQFNEIILDGIAFYWKENNVFYMSLDDGSVPIVDKIDLLKSLCGKDKTLRVFDTKEQIKMLQRCCSVLLFCSYQDPKVAYWLLSENWKEKTFSALTLDYLPASGTLVSRLGSIVGYSSPGLLVKSSTSHKTRACLEAFLTYHIIDKQLPVLREKGLNKAFEQTEMNIMISLAEMELTGFQICRNNILEIMEKLETAKEALEKKAYASAGYKFSLSSSAAVSRVLFKELGLEGDGVVLTKKRKLPSTSKEALKELSNETKHPLPEIILQWRKIRSVVTKFVSPLLRISSESTRVFGVSQTFTVTGRISMHEPNLQNIPKTFTLDFGKDESTPISLRDVFVASENCVLMSVDYCQIEFRLLAHLSQDLELIKNITDSSDIFVNIAANIYGVRHYDVDENLRQRAKQTCYGMIYGIGSKNLSQQLGIGETDALELMEDFKRKYKGVANYLEKILKECRKKGYISTLLGRRRYLPAINDSNQAVRLEAERQCINSAIQGSAADLVKTAMILWREKLDYLLSNGVTTRLVLHLHDELIFEVGKGSVEIVASVLKETLENAMNLLVPTPVKIKTGSSWGQLKNYDF